MAALFPDYSRFRPTRAVEDLGRPDRVFCCNAVMSAVFKGMVVVGLVVFGLGVGVIAGFFLTAPPHIQNQRGYLVGVIAGGSAAAALGGLIFYYGLRRFRSSCYLIFHDGLAFTQGKGWQMLAWEDVQEFRPRKPGHPPHLLMKDGRQIGIYESASYLQELHAEIQDRLFESRAGRGIGLDDSVHEEDDLLSMPAAKPESSEPEGSSHWGLMIGGVLLLLVGAGVYLYLEGLEKSGFEFRTNWIIVFAYKIGGKAVSAGLIAAVGLCVFLCGFVKMAQQARIQAQGKKKWGKKELGPQ